MLTVRIPTHDRKLFRYTPWLRRHPFEGMPDLNRYVRGNGAVVDLLGHDPAREDHRGAAMMQEPKASGTIVWVRRQWNDYREAAYRIEALSGWHWSNQSGGVHARSPRPFLYAYAACNAMVEGELAHSCQHGEGPHRILVCVTKSRNKAAWKEIEWAAANKSE